MKSSLATTCAGFLLILSVSALTAWMSSCQLPLTYPPAEPALAQAARAAGVEVIDTATARALLSAGTHRFLDARDATAYARGHLPGALSLPLRNFENVLPELLPVLMEGVPLVVYCDGPLCDDGLRLIGLLQEAGLPVSALYLDGMEGWTP